MPRKFKYKFSRKKSDYDKYSKKLSLGHRRLLLGTTDVIRNGMDALEVNVSKNIIKMFYVYLKIKLQEMDLREGEMPSVYTFMNKFIFGKLYDADHFKEYDIDELKNLFSKCYKVFVKDATDDDMLGRQLRKITNSRELDYLSILDLEDTVIKYVHDYIDFLYSYYVSKTLSLDNPLEIVMREQYIAKSDKNLEKKTNIDILDRGISQRVLEIKISFFNQTMITVKKDLEAYLTAKKYEDVKTQVMDKYNEYYKKLDERIHLKENFTPKIRTHGTFFDMMNKLKMNWVCNCADVKGGGSEYFYVYIYDLIMYKYRLLAYFLLNEYNIKTKKEVLDSLENIESYNEDERAYDFFTRKIGSAEDINAHIIKLFEKKHQKFIKTILAVETRTPYEKDIVNPTFLSLVDMDFKHAPLAALKCFPIQNS